MLWEQGYIEIKAAKAKTKAGRLVPLRPNLRAWLEPYRGRVGLVCHLPNPAVRLNHLGDKAGFGWRQNALGNSPEKQFRHYRESAAADCDLAQPHADGEKRGDERELT